jgi:divalent metal cation (Fe/Co/Zn/Cd) transporter
MRNSEWPSHVSSYKNSKRAGDGELSGRNDTENSGAKLWVLRRSGEMTRHIRRLQVVTLLWMLAECATALLAAWRARSPVLLAFGADSFVELLSAAVVLLQLVPYFTLSKRRAARLAGILLFILAGVITFTSIVALWKGVLPETSWIGIGVTIAALIVMPLLSSAKRRASKEARNVALSADAVQSATCVNPAADSNLNNG